MNNIELINQTLKEHIQSNVEHFADNISTPQTYFFLSMLFLQSVGFVEQKISCIVWEIGYREHLERYKIFKEYGTESIEFDVFKRLYKRLKNKDNLDNQIMIELKDIKNIIKYSAYLFEELEYNFLILEEKLSKELNNRDFIKELIKELREQRNFIAHFKSFYPDKSIISFCAKNENNKSIRFKDFLLYLAALIKVDEIFIEAFKDYESSY